MFIASLRTTAAIALVFLLLTITFFVLGIGNAGANTEHRQARRLLGLATAVAAWYASFAEVIEGHVRAHRASREAAHSLTTVIQGRIMATEEKTLSSRLEELLDQERFAAAG